MLNCKAAKIEEAMLIVPHKHTFLKELGKLGENCKEIKELEVEIKASLKSHSEDLKQQYTKTKETMNRCQLKMLFLLQHLEGQKEVNGASDSFRTPSITVTQPSGLSSLLESPLEFSYPINVTRTIEMGSLAKPLFAKKKPKALPSFTASVTDEEFSNIPAYMKGRHSLEDFQQFIDKAVIPTFNDKYRILAKPRTGMKTNELNLQNLFKSQANFFEGQKFITVGDLARILEKNVDKKDERFIQMMRHLQIIREVRQKSICCYIWSRDC